MKAVYVKYYVVDNVQQKLRRNKRHHEAVYLLQDSNGKKYRILEIFEEYWKVLIQLGVSHILWHNILTFFYFPPM